MWCNLLVQSERNTAVDDIRLTPDFKGISLSVHSHAVRLVHGAHGQNALSVSSYGLRNPKLKALQWRQQGVKDV